MMSVVLFASLNGCSSVIPTPTPAQPTTAASPTTVPTDTAALPTPTVSGAPSAQAGWSMVDSDSVAGTSRLYLALSADDAVYALTQTCADSCVHQVLVTSDGDEWRTMANQIPNADSVEDLGFADGRYVAGGAAGG